LSAVLLIALVSSVYAYWRFTTPSTPSFYVTASYPPLELRVQLDKTEFALGEEVAVHLSLRNLNNRQVNITFSYLGVYVDFKILDKKNTVVFLTWYGGWQPALDEVTLAPQGQLSKILLWDQTSQTKEFYGQQVLADTYRIVGCSGPIYKIDQEKFVPAFEIEAPQMQITIS
jgi:hypothetical protein